MFRFWFSGTFRIHYIPVLPGVLGVLPVKPEPLKVFEASGNLNYLCHLPDLDGRAWLVAHILRGGAGASGRPYGSRSVWAGGVGVLKDLLAAALDRPGGAVVNRGGGVQPAPEMAALVVVLGEDVAERTRCFQVRELPGKPGSIGGPKC